MLCAQDKMGRCSCWKEGGYCGAETHAIERRQKSPLSNKNDDVQTIVIKRERIVSKDLLHGILGGILAFLAIDTWAWYRDRKVIQEAKNKLASGSGSGV